MNQYFDKEVSLKNKLLVKQIENFDFQIAANEIDALVLEQTLINEYEPKFNIKIKGAKVYPYIELSKNKVVSVKVSIRPNKKNVKYFGPYPDGFSSRKIVKLLQHALPIDKCYGINSGKKCINYNMNRCLGYCFKEVSEHEKEFFYKKASEFLSGKTTYIKNKLKEQLEHFNETMQYEESEKIFNYLEIVKKIENEQNNNFNDSLHRDVFNFYEKDGILSISIIHIRFGNISFTTNFITEIENPEDNEEIISFIFRYYLDKPVPDEIISPFKFE